MLGIRNSIRASTQDETQQQSLKEYLEQKAPTLHRNISLPHDCACQSLMVFLRRYVEHTADCIDAFSALIQHSDARDFAQPFINVIEGFFVSPPDYISAKHSGLHALVDEAYLAHRFIEELNDKMLVVSGVPLAPMDMTVSNLIVHEILGEEFANELDAAASYCVDSLFNEETLPKKSGFKRYVQHRQQTSWKKDTEQWPCLAGDSSIFLVMNNGITKTTIH